MYQDVTRNKNLSAAAKGLYAYLSAFCGTSDECYPSIGTITSEMSMGKDTFYRHINALVAAGVVQKHQTVGTDGKFGRTIYRLTHEVNISEKTDFPFTQNRDAIEPETVGKETIKNSIKKEQYIKNNNVDVCPEPETSAPDCSGILLPLVDKTDYDVPFSQIEKWRDAYPAVDIEQELKKMIAWLNANPSRKKTRRGINRFINTWLSREQDKGGRYRGNNYNDSNGGKRTSEAARYEAEQRASYGPY